MTAKTEGTISKVQLLGIEKAQSDFPEILNHLDKLVRLKTEEIRLAFGCSGLIISENHVASKEKSFRLSYHKSCKITLEEERAEYLAAYVKELGKHLVGVKLPEPKLGAEAVIKRNEYVWSV